jgi:hypothetical protein
MEDKLKSFIEEYEVPHVLTRHEGHLVEAVIFVQPYAIQEFIELLDIDELSGYNAVICSSGLAVPMGQLCLAYSMSLNNIFTSNTETT